MIETSLTFEVWSFARHEELDGLYLGQVTVLVLLLCVAVSPVVQTEPQDSLSLDTVGHPLNATVHNNSSLLTL